MISRQPVFDRRNQPQAGVPLNLLHRWLGHSSISTTAIYAAASGPEEIALAERYWNN